MQAQVVPGVIVIYINGLHVLGPAGLRYLDGYEGRTLMMILQKPRHWGLPVVSRFPPELKGPLSSLGGFVGTCSYCGFFL